MLPTCRRARPWLGTLVDVQAEGLEAEAAVAAAFDEIAAVHALLSFYAADSELHAINRAPPGAQLRVDPRTLTVLRLASTLHAASARAFDCRVGTPEQLADTRFPVAFAGDVVCKQTHALINLGGIAKGYAVDRAIETIQGFAVENAIVNAGGDLRHRGSNPTTVQIRDPRNAARITATVLLDNAALATSTVGGLGAGPDDPSRIHNADRLALPALAGATVQAPTCVLADALTKIVLATGDATHPLLAEYGAAVTVYSPG
ncbi:FAD:protein FMN transferase [Ralstonia pickettii]|uniref:FAD:protein FMN transferase n=1 Tax=Ralstonia pickettii TaxID=329 RepID=UPI0015BEF31E|nr:FAD:protein FMN transferase [Ralstonia pickettii]NWK43442.1 FAD:protein FMN transferase [Ralstonia pickettii]